MTEDWRLPELDYAFLASWAGIQADGTKTAVGMGFLRVVQAAATPIAVAGRIRVFNDSDPTPFSIRVVHPRVKRSHRGDGPDQAGGSTGAGGGWWSRWPTSRAGRSWYTSSSIRSQAQVSRRRSPMTS